MALTADVLVVGGGPAGASTAFQLARAGARVVVLERAHFPRDKACAECLSPQAARLLDDMGVLDALRPRASHLRGMRVRAPSGRVATGDYDAVPGFRAHSDTGLGVRRDLLDVALLESARGAGARVEQGMQVTDVLREGGRVSGVRVRAGSAEREVRAPFVVAADGLRSVVARRVGLARTARWPRRIALVAHYRDVGEIGPYVEMHVERDGFVGIADVGDGVTTVAAVFPATRARQFAADRGAFLARWIEARPQLQARFARARSLHVPFATGPFAAHARRAWAPGVLLAGDAADFFDPFTGEGIYAALRGGELAAAALLDALTSHADEPLRAYDRARRREFAGKWKVERLVAAGVAVPAVVNRAVAAMAARKPLADLLAGVTGDFVPASHVLRLPYLAQLFLTPTRD